MLHYGVIRHVNQSNTALIIEINFTSNIFVLKILRRAP